MFLCDILMPSFYIIYKIYLSIIKYRPATRRKAYLCGFGRSLVLLKQFVIKQSQLSQ